MPSTSSSFARYSVMVRERISAKLDDARAHAGKAVTDALKATEDGRPTLRRARHSPSLRAAHARLDELLDLLAGPSVASLDGLIRHARAVFYLNAHAKWKPMVPDELRVSPDPTATVAEVQAARGLVLHGMDLRTELQSPIRTAKTALAAAVARAGSAGGSPDLLDGWLSAARGAITRAAELALSDSFVALDGIAGRDLIDPELIDLTPLED